MAQSASPVRYAVVGAGWIAQEAFMPGVQNTGNSVLRAIVSGNERAARRLAEFHAIDPRHIYPYERYDEMLEADVVDAVYIALPNSLHAAYTIAAARAGKHCLVEKPLATSVEDCEAMIAAAAAAEVSLMTAYRLHHEPGTIDVLERIRAGEIGDPRFFTSVFSYPAERSNHRLRAEHWGGPLQDIGVYCLNAARHVFAAEPTEALALTSTPPDDPRFTEVPESVSALLRFPGERIATFTASFNAEALDGYQVVGTDGALRLEPGFHFQTAMRLHIDQHGRHREIDYPRIDHFGAQTAYFSDCILNATRPESDGEEGLADVRALLAIERSAASGRAEPIDSPARARHPTPDMIRLIEPTEHRLVLEPNTEKD